MARANSWQDQRPPAPSNFSCASTTLANLSPSLLSPYPIQPQLRTLHTDNSRASKRARLSPSQEMSKFFLVRGQRTRYLRSSVARHLAMGDFALTGKFGHRKLPRLHMAIMAVVWKLTCLSSAGTRLAGQAMITDLQYQSFPPVTALTASLNGSLDAV